LGQPDPLDWYDLYKVWEILQHAAGGPKKFVTEGWVTSADINRFKASADHPSISGDAARHAREKSTPGPTLRMPLDQADTMMRGLAAKWIESLPAF
jgi:hypothetical protein